MFEQENRRFIKQEIIPNTKSRHLIIMNNLKKKEENWNNRFYVPSSNKNESVDKHKGNLTLTQKLLDVQNQFQIPEFHRELFNLCLKTLPKPQQAIQFEIEEMQNKKAHIQLCIQAIEAREKCLSTLQNVIYQIADLPNDETLKSKTAELITHLRILTINVVEQVIAWRQYLMKFLVNIHSQQSIQLPYFYHRENYLFKIKRDTQFVQSSVLTQYYAFSSKPDPFFVSITKATEDTSKIVQYVSKLLLRRIKACENILAEENSFQSDNKSIHNRNANSRDSIHKSPEKPIIAAGRIRPKRQNISHSRAKKDNFIAQLDVLDYKEHKMSPEKPSKAFKDFEDHIPIPPPPASKQEGQSKRVSHQKEAINEALRAAANINLETGAPQKQEPEKVPPKRTVKCNLTDQDVQDYLQVVPEDMLKSCRADYDLMKNQYDQNDDSFCLGIFDGKLVAFAQCHLDSALTSERKLILSHFSSISIESYSEHLKNILSQIWNNDPCQEVRIPMYHYEQNQKLEANKELTAKLKELGFKWKVVQSINASTRFTVMAIRRPGDAPTAELSDPIYLQHLTFEAQLEKPTSSTEFVSVTTQCCLAQSVKFENEEMQKLSDVLKESGYAYPGVKMQVQDREEHIKYVHQYFESFDSIIKPDEYQLQERVASSLAKECYRFKQYKFAQLSGYLYNHFKVSSNPDQATVCVLESATTPIYLLSTDQKNVQIFIYEYDGAISISQVQQLFANCQNQVPISKDLYLPQFVVRSKAQIQGNILSVGQFSTRYKPKFVDINKVDDSHIIIKPPFVFGLISDEFNEIYNLPSVFLQVKENDLITL